MLTNDILRRVRYALDLNDSKVIELFALTGYKLDDDCLKSMFTKDDDESFVLCSDEIAHRFFSGLIISLRGRKDTDSPSPARADRLTGNDVLWYLRIALSLRDDDVLAILKKGGMEIGKAELSAFFRKKDHSNYRSCQDQMLRNFLAGFTATYRP